MQETVLANADRLVPHLPDQQGLLEPKRELEETVGNPQFRQAADFFGHALQTGKLAEALQHFNIGEKALASATKGGMIIVLL